MKNSFSVLGENLFSRNFGGTSAGIADPYLSGYAFLWPDKLPTGLVDYVAANGSSGIATKAEIQNVLAASCLSVTPPGGTLNTVEFTGLGGTKWGVPGNIDYGTTLSAKFLEFTGMPILDIFHNWVKMIRDLRTGVTDLVQGSDATGYSKKTYSGMFYYWTTSPDGETVQNYAAYDGVYPSKDPMDLYSFDIENVSKLEVEIEFHIDKIWHEPWVRTKCEALASAIGALKSTVKGYGIREM